MTPTPAALLSGKNSPLPESQHLLLGSVGKGEAAWRGEDTFVGSQPSSVCCFPSVLTLSCKGGCLFLFTDVTAEAQRSKVT